MTVRLSGADFKAFWADTSWFPSGPKGGAVDDESVFLNNDAEPLSTDETDYPDQINDSDRVRVVGGVVDDYDSGEQHALGPILKAWLDKRTTVAMVITVKKDRLAEVTAALKQIPGLKIGM